MDKKGAINLSINMIIVLIIAIIILGFALSFITSTLGKAEESLWDQFPTVEIAATPERPVGFPETFLVSPNQERPMKIQIYNGGAVAISSVSTPTVSCSPTGTTFTVPSHLTPISPSIPQGGYGYVPMVIKAGPSLDDNAICTMTVATSKATFFVKVR